MLSNDTNKERDADLVARALNDKDAFAEIISSYELPLRRYLVRLGCRDTHDVEDLLQDIFLKVYVNLNEFEHDLQFSSWIYRIAHNETISFFRKKNIRPTTVTTEEDLQLFTNVADEEDFIQLLNDRMNLEIFRTALAQLEGQYRDVLVLRFLENKNYAEISDILKIPIGTVGTAINRGKKLLRDRVVSKISNSRLV